MTCRGIRLLGYTSAVLGDRAKAAQILRELEDLSKKRYVSPANVSANYLGLGEKEKAFDWLDKAFADQDPVLWWISGDELYDSVRNEPRFQALFLKVSDLKGRRSHGSHTTFLRRLEAAERQCRLNLRDNLRLEIGHILFIDIVGYSKLLIEKP